MTGAVMKTVFPDADARYRFELEGIGSVEVQVLLGGLAARRNPPLAKQDGGLRLTANPLRGIYEFFESAFHWHCRQGHERDGSPAQADGCTNYRVRRRVLSACQ